MYMYILCKRKRIAREKEKEMRGGSGATILYNPTDKEERILIQVAIRTMTERESLLRVESMKMWKWSRMRMPV